eukprot:gnl/Spiro4/11307_TR5966_c0_g1_i1.p1 gnl/Spiro4/11307_TR5966_c0_g1~~gnl/Spiro4/11307_TR5966_c0_g1_i1.p1  ORF type:complete len:627 (+),score=115.50 gnl/Spiro4/11307_TR5966_c0_g1_i1:141-1883(+)
MSLRPHNSEGIEHGAGDGALRKLHSAPAIGHGHAAGVGLRPGVAARRDIAVSPAFDRASANRGALRLSERGILDPTLSKTLQIGLSTADVSEIVARFDTGVSADPVVSSVSAASPTPPPARSLSTTALSASAQAPRSPRACQTFGALPSSTPMKSAPPSPSSPLPPASPEGASADAKNSLCPPPVVRRGSTSHVTEDGCKPIAIIPIAVEAPTSPILRTSSVGSRFDPKFLSLVVRACRGPLAENETSLLVSFLVSVPPPVAEAYHTHAQTILGHGLPQISLNKLFLSFGGYEGGCPLGSQVSEEVTVTNAGAVVCAVSFSDVDRPDLEFRCEPANIELKRGQSTTVRAILKVIQPGLVREVFSVVVQGGVRHLLATNMRTEPSLFGVDLDPASFVPDPHNSLPVPQVLVTLKEHFIAGGGLLSEGVFRVQASTSEVAAAKSQLNRGIFTGCSDVHTVANLIKIWFRELPDKLLNPVYQSMDHTDDYTSCYNAYQSLPDPNRDLLAWLLDLLAEVAAHEASNKMNVKNLAVILAPNLFHPHAKTAGSDAIALLNLTAKTAQFLCFLLQATMEQKLHRGES